jgi:hypothetical protein
MSKKTSDELSAGKKPISEAPFHKHAARDRNVSGKGLPGNPDSKPWIHNRVSDHDKSQREKGRH